MIASSRLVHDGIAIFLLYCVFIQDLLRLISYRNDVRVCPKDLSLMLASYTSHGSYRLRGIRFKGTVQGIEIWHKFKTTHYQWGRYGMHKLDNIIGR